MCFREIGSGIGMACILLANMGSHVGESEEKARTTIEKLKGMISRDVKTGAIIVVYLSNANATDLHLQHISAIRTTQQLFLGATAVTDAGLASIVNLKELRTLSVAHTKVGDPGLRFVGQMHALE
jgi:hypothetical protein